MDGLRLVFVNHCHPEMTHVCALRARGFAEAMARRGHRVVLLSETLNPDDEAITTDAFGRNLRAHDWKNPYRLSCPPRPAPLLRRARVGRLPWPCNKAVLAAAYAIDGGPFADWVDGARPYFEVLTDEFQPQAAWGIFGNTGAWLIAREIAKRAAAPWVMDLKDSWTGFVPMGLRVATARRFHDAAAVTVLGEKLRDEASRYFRPVPEILYSGIDALQLGHHGDVREPSHDQIALIGSIYSPRDLERLVAGVRDWLATRARRSTSQRARLVYFGTDEAAVCRAFDAIDTVADIDIRGYRPLGEMLSVLRRSLVNVYVCNPWGLFHHKLFDLLSAGRPILCLPGESDEARRIAHETGGHLISCASASQVTEALQTLVDAQPTVTPGDGDLARYTWDAQAAVLERVLGRAVG